MNARGASLATVLLLLLIVAACTEENNSLVTKIGTVGFVVTDPDLGAQVVSIGVPPESTLQVIEWELAPPADLERLDNGTKEDLLFAEPCTFVQTTKSSYNPIGRCSGGIILGSSDDTGALSPPGQVPATFVMDVQWMKVRRAEPEKLPANADSDADRINNEDDNCPLMPNEDQTDSNGDGVGDVCSVTDFFGSTVLDSDGDKVADSVDNCVWTRNPLQEDTTGVSAEYGIPDGIGDACNEQVAWVIEPVPGSSTRLSGEFTIGLATGGLSFVTVDFAGSVDPDLCDWGTDPEPGSCPQNLDAVSFCGTEGLISAALNGCAGS